VLQREAEAGTAPLCQNFHLLLSRWKAGGCQEPSSVFPPSLLIDLFSMLSEPYYLHRHLCPLAAAVLCQAAAYRWERSNTGVDRHNTTF